MTSTSTQIHPAIRAIRCLGRRLGMVLLVLSGLWPVKAPAMTDPLGEVSPVFRAMGDTFVLDFTERRRSPAGEFFIRFWRIVYSKDGKVLIPRHRIEQRFEQKRGSSGETITNGFWVGQDYHEKSSSFFLSDWTHGKLHWMPLPLDANQIEYCHLASVTDQGIGIVCTKLPPMEQRYRGYSDLWVAHVDRKGFQPAKLARLGWSRTSRGGPPSASAAIWSQGRWWVAWVRGPVEWPIDTTDSDEREPLPPLDLKLVLSSLDPTTGEIQHQLLNAEVNEYTEVQLASNDGWMALAWRLKRGDGHEETDRLMTTFVELPRNP
ncbi:MAG: hypothetical protein ACAI34_21100 [Verrucomicrobium sp.]|nr:hypothetical protein [Verrucomicrobium sp.]